MPETLYFFFENIPASDKEPFVVKIGGNVVFTATTSQKNTSHTVQITPSGLSAIHREFINFVIPQADIDELNQYDLTNRGYYFRVRVKKIGELSVLQGLNKNFEEENAILDDQRKFYVDEKTGEYTYKYNKPVYLADDYEKSPKAKIAKAIANSADFGTDSTRIWIHLSGIDANEEEPFEILDADQEDKNLFKSTKPIFKRKEVMLYVRKADPTAKSHVANLHIKIPSVGVDSVVDFDLTTLGTHILIAVLNEGSNVEIQQKTNKMFDEKFFNPVHYANAEREYKEKTRVKTTTKYNDDDDDDSAPTPQQVAKQGDSESLDEVTITLYVNNIPASKKEPFTIYMNGDEFFKSEEEISLTRTTVLRASFDKPPRGEELIVEIRFKIDARDVDTKQQFNITKNGTFLFFGIEKAAGDSERIQMKQQHNDTFGPQSSQQTATKPTSGNASSSSSDIIPVYFHLANINASAEKPFELFVNGQPIYKQTQDLGDKMAIVTGKLPKIDDLRIDLRAVAKADGLEEESELNITKYGNYLKIEVSSDRSVIDITQADNADFDNATIVDSKKMPSKSTSSTSSSTSTKTSPSEKKTTTTSQQPSSTSSGDYLDQLKKLGELRDAGILTEEEFQAKKKKILGL